MAGEPAANATAITTAAEEGLAALPLSKGSGAVSSFSQADGFLTVDALSGQIAEGRALVERVHRGAILRRAR